MIAIYNIATSRFNDNIYTLNSISTSLTQELIISSNQTLIIPRGYTLNISSGGGQIDNSGAIINYGTLTIDGTLNSTGIINNEFGGTITNNNTINNNGKILNRNTYSGPGYLYGNFPLNVNGGTYNSLKLVGCVGGGNIYTNYGDGTWNPQASVENWSSITSSASGQYLAACVGGGNSIYTSNDYGNTWSPSQTSTTDGKPWNTIASSASGQYVVACYSPGNGGGIYTSNDYGVTWSITSALSLVWNSVASSSY